MYMYIPADAHSHTHTHTQTHPPVQKLRSLPSRKTIRWMGTAHRRIYSRIPDAHADDVVVGVT